MGVPLSNASRTQAQGQGWGVKYFWGAWGFEV